MNNIILIGMPGCGKSTIGVVLAKNLGFRFIDSDLLIQEREHRLLFAFTKLWLFGSRNDAGINTAAGHHHAQS